ncbi:hypothetical protein ACQEWB_11675 [Streptomyces sp. CA-249302]|uniref:hypothetical protein n=1 Tax=Streptomyces sp. CA-249302 TaxID=3240058 RepID=UPI003D8CF2A5
MRPAQAALCGAHAAALGQMPDKLRSSLLAFLKDGDGYLLVWPSNLMALVVSCYVPAFKDSIAKQNVDREPSMLLRARLAVATGLAETAELGIAGQGAVEAKRLVDAEQAKLLQEEFPEQQLVVILSRYAHEQTIRVGWAKGVDPEAFVPVVVLDKWNEKRDAHLTVPGRTVDEVRRTLNPSLLTRMRRYFGKTVMPGVKKVVRAVPKLVLAAALVPAMAACAVAVLAPVAFSTTRGEAPGDGSAWAEGTASAPTDRPGPATSRSLDERPTLTPQTQELRAVPVPGREGAVQLRDGAQPPNCLTGNGKGQPLTLETCRPGDRTQEWAAP